MLLCGDSSCGYRGEVSSLTTARHRTLVLCDDDEGNARLPLCSHVMSWTELMPEKTEIEKCRSAALGRRGERSSREEEYQSVERIESMSFSSMGGCASPAAHTYLLL